MVRTPGNFEQSSGPILQLGAGPVYDSTAVKLEVRKLLLAKGASVPTTYDMELHQVVTEAEKLVVVCQ